MPTEGLIYVLVEGSMLATATAGSGLVAVGALLGILESVGIGRVDSSGGGARGVARVGRV